MESLEFAEITDYFETVEGTPSDGWMIDVSVDASSSTHPDSFMVFTDKEYGGVMVGTSGAKMGVSKEGVNPFSIYNHKEFGDKGPSSRFPRMEY